MDQPRKRPSDAAIVLRQSVVCACQCPARARFCPTTALTPTSMCGRRGSENWKS